VLYREAETGKRLISRAQAIGILADVPIANLRWDQIVACDVVGRSAWELICSINNVIAIFEERQNVFNSTLHIVEVMRASYPTRCLLKLGIDELQKARDVGGEHNRSSIHVSPAIIFHAVAFSIQPLICFSLAFVPLFQVLGHRLELRSQFGKGLLYVNVAGRVCELQTFFGLLEICLRRQHDGTKRSWVQFAKLLDRSPCSPTVLSRQGVERSARWRVMAFSMQSLADWPGFFFEVFDSYE
jgi:hypothetical protein